MGQYLAIGLATKMKVSKEAIKDSGLELDAFQEEMTKQFNFPPQIYAVSCTESCYIFTLKEKLLQEQLIPLLNELYPVLYDNSAYYEGVIKKLNSLPTATEWLQWAERKPEEAFQFSRFCGEHHLRLPFNKRIKISYDCLLLSLEGKIMMEVYGRQFNFFEYTMRQTFKAFSIAGALKTYITG